VDITSCPRTNVLRELAEHASDPDHKNFLLEVTSASEEGKVCQPWSVFVSLIDSLQHCHGVTSGVWLLLLLVVVGVSS